MRIFGGLILLLYAFIAFSGYEPFTTARRGAPPTAAKGRTGGGGLLWFGGISGGK